VISRGCLTTNGGTRTFQGAHLFPGLTVLDNILAGRHRNLSADFGNHGISVEQRFAGGSWRQLATGAPVLADAAANLDCRIASVAEVGTHSVFFCEVRGIATAPQPEGLIYFNRLYHPIGASLKSVDEAYA